MHAWRRLRGRRLEEAEGFAMGFDGDYDECDDPKRQWAKSLVHHTIVDALTRFLKDCGMVEVKKEYKYWDPARVGKDGSRRVPDVTCVNPNTGTEYVLEGVLRPVAGGHHFLPPTYLSSPTSATNHKLPISRPHQRKSNRIWWLYLVVP